MPPQVYTWLLTHFPERKPLELTEGWWLVGRNGKAIPIAWMTGKVAWETDAVDEGMALIFVGEWEYSGCI